MGPRLSANRVWSSDGDGKTIPRFIVIRFHRGWVVWDNLRGRVSDGMYRTKEMARDVCDWFNEDPASGDRDWFAKGTHFEEGDKQWGA